MHTSIWTWNKTGQLRNVEVAPIIVVEGAHLVRRRVTVVASGSSHCRGMHIRFRVHAVIKHHAIMETPAVVPIVVRSMSMVLAMVIGHIRTMMISHVRIVRRRRIMMVVSGFYGWSVWMIVVKRMGILRPIYTLGVIGRRIFLSPASLIASSLTALGDRLSTTGTSRPRFTNAAVMGMEFTISRGLFLKRRCEDSDKH